MVYYEKYIKLVKPAKSDKIHMQLANLKAIIQMEKDQKNNPQPPAEEPNAEPSTEPSTEPSAEPSADPSADPSAEPSAE